MMSMNDCPNVPDHETVAVQLSFIDSKCRRGHGFDHFTFTTFTAITATKRRDPSSDHENVTVVQLY